MDPLADDILDFWFGTDGQIRDVWFRKDPVFDATIRERYGDAVEAAIGGAFEHWTADPRGALACVLMLDQFTRNIHRDTPKAFAGDARALVLAQNAVATRQDVALGRHERSFLYLPFEHSEGRSVQEQSIAVFTRLRDETGLGSPLEWAVRHAAIIRQFGRYPHRNAVLGRASTPEEIAFLQQPGSRF